MILRNYTPFVPILFQSRDVRGEDYWVLVVRGTFKIDPFGSLTVDPKQCPIVTSDTFHGDPHTSSLRTESDLVPFKPRSDIHINAIAHAPGHREATNWSVRAQIGTIEKTLCVTGPRRWIKQHDGYRLTEPEPCTEVPIRYELAFGGTWKNNWGEYDVFQENPLGVGYVKAGQQPTEDEVPAPQIEAPNDAVREVGGFHRPQGFGPIGRVWLPRRRLAGTYDETWKTRRAPELPLDFSFDYYNSAHPDLVYPEYLRGDEQVLLSGLCPDGTLQFSLPGYRIELMVKQMLGHFSRLALVLDTLSIDVLDGQVHIVWRTKTPKVPHVRTFDIILEQAIGG